MKDSKRIKCFIQTLGTGSADQIPVHGCQCLICKNARKQKYLQRKNCTNLFKYLETFFLIDCGYWIFPDVFIDFILISHLHLDHIQGLTKLKWSKQEDSIPVYLPNNTNLDFMINLFDYYYLNFPFPNHQKKSGTNLKFITYKNLETISVKNIKITPIKLNHNVPTFGFLISVEKLKLAYLVDTKNLSTSSKTILEKFSPNVVLIDSTFPSNVSQDDHNNIKEAIDFVTELNTSLAILTHISHSLSPEIEIKKYKRENGNKNLDNICIAKDNQIFDLTYLL